MSYEQNQSNPSEILVVTEQYDANNNLIATIKTHYCWFTQLSLSGPATLAVNTPGTYTLVFTDWEKNPLTTSDTVTVHTIDASGIVQNITVNIINGQGTFQFSSAVAGTFILNAQAQNTVCDVLPQGGLKVVVS